MCYLILQRPRESCVLSMVGLGESIEKIEQQRFIYREVASENEIQQPSEYATAITSTDHSLKLSTFEHVVSSPSIGLAQLLR